MSNITRRDWLVMEHSTLVTVNRHGDIYCNADIRPFIDSRCRFDKVAKSGLVCIYLDGDIRKRASVPKSNIDLLMDFRPATSLLSCVNILPK